MVNIRSVNAADVAETSRIGHDAFASNAPRPR